MHTNTFCKYRKNYSHRLACILLLLVVKEQIKVCIAPHGTMTVVKYKDSNIINNATNTIRRMQKRTNNKEMKQDQNTEIQAERNVT